jgi:hypothetical protein
MRKRTLSRSPAVACLEDRMQIPGESTRTYRRFTTPHSHCVRLGSSCVPLCATGYAWCSSCVPLAMPVLKLCATSMKSRWLSIVRSEDGSYFSCCKFAIARAEDRATQRCDPSAAPGPKSKGGGRLEWMSSRLLSASSLASCDKPSRQEAAICLVGLRRGERRRYVRSPILLSEH